MMIEVRDCYKNVKLRKKNIGLFPYYIHNHPIKDVHEKVEIIYVDFYTEDGFYYHFEHDEIGNVIEADKYCIYVKGDAFEGKPITDMTVRTKYFYNFEVPDPIENMPLDRAQMGLKLNKSDVCDKVYGELENNALNGILRSYDDLRHLDAQAHQIEPTATISVDTSDGTYSYSWVNNNE